MEDICESIGIRNINEQLENKENVEKAIFYHNYLEMKLDINKYDKLEDVKNEDLWKVPEYMNIKSLDKVKMAFSIRCKMVNI